MKYPSFGRRQARCRSGGISAGAAKGNPPLAGTETLLREPGISLCGEGKPVPGRAEIAEYGRESK